MGIYQILLIIFVTYSLLTLVGIALYGYLNDNWYVFIPMPKDFKKNTRMNWFGCIVCYIVLFMLFPVLHICKLIYWLFHI